MIDRAGLTFIGLQQVESWADDARFVAAEMLDNFPAEKTFPRAKLPAESQHIAGPEL